MGLVAKTILPERLCSVWAARMTISNTIGIIAGAAVFFILKEFPGYQGFGILYLIAFGVLTLSYIIFGFIHETDIPPADDGKRVSLKENLRNIPALMKNDPDFRLFLLVRVLGNSVILAMALFSPQALKATACSPETVGTFIWASIIGSYLATAVASYVGDRYGAKIILLTARLIIAANFIFVIYASSLWMFYLIFGLSGFAFTLGMVAMSTLPIKLTPKEKRATYLSVMGLLNIPFTILFGVLGGVLFDLSGQDITLPAATASALMLFSIFFLLKLKEPATNLTRS
jgi:MFS family permease